MNGSVSLPARTEAKPVVLVVGAINRADIVSMFAEAKDAVELHFLEYYYNWGTPVDPRVYEPFGALHCWHEFSSAEAVLARIRPDRILFFYITSLNQISLNVTARQRGIHTYHLEHGFRRSYDLAREVLRARSASALAPRRWSLEKVRREVRYTFGNHRFFWRSMRGLPFAVQSRLARFSVRSAKADASPDELEAIAELRRPDDYIAFSEETLAYHVGQDRIPESQATRARLIGIPYFDSLCNLPTAAVDPANAILVDHQYHNGKFFGWTPEYKRTWVREFVGILREKGLRLYVKRHPGDTSGAWEPYLERGKIEEVDLAGLREVLPRTGLVFGSFSTMLFPLLAAPQTTVIALEIHPDPSARTCQVLDEQGVAHPVTSFAELSKVLDDLAPLREAQRARKKDAVRRLMTASDGEAGRRLRAVVVGG